MPEEAGGVNIVLRLNSASYSAAIKEAQAQLDAFAGKAKGAGHSTVSSMQASSAAIRELKNPLGDNTRAIERFITTIPGVGTALKAAFPLVGGIAFGVMLFEAGAKVVEFIQKARAMPLAIADGFASLNLSQKTATDSMNVITDKLNDAHAAFEKKPSDGLKTGIDEARVSADKFAASVVAANAKVNELLSKNHLSGWAILMGKVGTGDVDDAQKEYSRVQDHNAYNLANSTPGSPEQDAAKRAIADTLAGYLGDRQRELAGMVSKNYSNQYGAGIAANEGIISGLKGQQADSSASDSNAAAEAQAAKDKAAKDAAENAKLADAKRLTSMVAALKAEEVQNGMSLKVVYAYWEQRKSAFAAGSAAYNEVVSKQADLAVEGAKSAHERIAKIRADQSKDSDESVPDPSRIMAEWAKRSSDERTQVAVDSNSASIDSAQNASKEKQSTIGEQAGRTITRFDAALQIAAAHTEEFNTLIMSLQSIVDARSLVANGDPTPENQRALTAAIKALDDAKSKRGIEVGKDNQAAYGPGSSSAIVGAKDALADFVMASRDAATQMRDLVGNTLRGLNQQIVAGMMGKRTDFKGVGSDMFKSVATTGLQKTEGSVLSHLGLGKGPTLGTSSNPMFVRMAGAVGSVAGSIGGAVGSTAGKLGGVFGSMLKSFLPGFADGGYLNGPSLVGENGPEIFNPSGSGHVIPNHKLTGGGGGDIHFHPGAIDARGATDPAQVDAAVQRGIRAAAPHLMAGSVRAVGEQKMRRPSR